MLVLMVGKYTQIFHIEMQPCHYTAECVLSSGMIRKSLKFLFLLGRDAMNRRNFALILAASTFLTGAAYAADPIKVGLSGPFTGGSSSMGVSMRDGVKLAVDEINKAGGVLGRPILLVERDDEAKNEVGVQVAQELINKEKVVATLGYINTGVALAAQRFYQEAQIPVFNNVATGSVVTKQFLPPDHKNNYIFRNAANDTIQSAMIVEEALRQGFKKPAILADSTNYGQLGRADMEAALATKSVKAVAVEKFNIKDTDMTAQILRAKEAGADVILTYAIGPELAQIANGMAKLGWKVPMIGSWTLSMASYIDTAGANADGALMPQTFIQVPSTPKRAAFIAAYQKMFNVDRMPSPVSAAQGYDSVYLLAAAIKQAGSTEGPKIREALENLNTKVEGVVTIYDKPFSATDHEAISSNIPVMGLVKGGKVIPAHPEDLAGDKALRVKPKA
jgi:branched-chain amino acid transport system substrate-binding protein